MKNLTIIYISLFLISISTLVQAQNRPEIKVRAAGERPIYWLHGLGGSQYSWDRVATAVQIGATGFAAREVQGLKPTYGPNSLASAALGLEVEMKTLDAALDNNNNGLPISENLIIAHSQGGLVARKLDQIFNSPTDPDRRFGGLVTFGTPHGGAYILNSVRNNDHQDFITEACQALIGGQSELLEGKFIVDLFGIDNDIEDVVNIICEDFAVLGVEQFLDDYTSPITDDYYVGAPVLQNLNTYSHPYIEKVAFYSEEDDPVFWRLVHSLYYPPNDFPPFGANADSQSANEAITNRNRAHNKYLAWDIIADTHPLSMGIQTQAELYDIRDAFGAARDWWENANEKWEFLIGAQKIEDVFADECACWGPLDGNGHPTRVYFSESNPAFCITHESPPDITDCLPVYNTQTVSYESDGVVVESSAKAFPGATQVMLIGSNHQQMRNDNQTKIALYDLFEGDHGSYFATPVR